MKKTQWSAWLLVLGSFLALVDTSSVSAQAQPTVAGFVRIDTIKGDVLSAAFKDQHIAELFSFSESAPVSTASGAGTGVGKLTVDPVKLRLSVSSATPLFISAVEKGTVFSSLVVSLVDSSNRVTTQLTFANARFSSARSAWSNSAGKMSLELELVYSTVKWQATPIQPDGSLGPNVIYMSATPGSQL